MNYKSISLVLRDFLLSKGLDASSSVTLAGKAGSGRQYYRIKRKNLSYILLLSPKKDQDYGRFLRITQFYRMLRIPVPRVFCIDDPSHQVILEDLGKTRLYDLVRRKKNITPSYRSVLKALIHMQTEGFAHHLECPDISSRHFDKPQLLWETAYFTREYLNGFRKLKINGPHRRELQNFFLELAQRVDAHPKTVMHRDFQCQNLMVEEGHIRVIDYQGSRLGSMYYDLASLLLDPYAQLNESQIKNLFLFYHSRSLSSLSAEDAFLEFLHAGSQRVMQALGAYCFLSRRKGLVEFAAHIKPGEKRLSWILEKLGRRDILKG